MPADDPERGARVALAPGRARWAVPAVVALLVGAAAGCRTGASSLSSPTVGGGAQGGLSSRVSSNILRADYAGSASCEGCHAGIFAAWRDSPMHEMTRVPQQARIRAPFAGEAFRFKDDLATFEQKDGARFMRVVSPRYGDHVYRVTRVIGGRYREDYAGVEVGAARLDAPLVGGGRPGAELLLPVSYLFETRSFRLKGYSVMVGARPGLRAGGVWNETCVFCHNTTPYFDSTWGALHGGGAPAYQGEVVDRLLPAARRWAFEISDDDGLRAALRDEVALVAGADAAAALPAERRAGLAAGMRALRSNFGAEHFVELGVGCESCHGGSREHVQRPGVLPDFAPRSRFLRTRGPDGAGAATRAEEINRVCARCHQVLFSHYPFTWEGGLRRGGAPGGSSITSGEGRDFLLGGCAQKMACTACHDPHAADQPAALARLATPEGNAVCTGCHPAYREPAALRAHAHHDPAGEGGACVACHMPRKNLGLGSALTRYHRIGSPTDPARVEKDRPLECALCHADRTVAQLIGDMERWWGRRYDRGALAALYGESLDRNALVATVERGKAHEQAPAMVALAAQHRREGTLATARQVLNPFPLVRTVALRALQGLTGGGCAIDLDRSDAEIAAALGRCLPAAVPAAPGNRGDADVAAPASRRGDDSDED